MMNYYKTKIQYCGTNYIGLQWQKEKPTIQSELNYAISRIITGKFTTVAASRTDSGVHAFEQIVKISSEDKIEINLFLEEVNSFLPRDIRFLEIENCHALFRPQVESITKEYRYLFTNNLKNSDDISKYISNIYRPLNLIEMNKCAQHLIGCHDFVNFYSSGSNVKSTRREIKLCEINIINPQSLFKNTLVFNIPNELTKCFELKIIANGFLKQMVRHIVSALWMVGSGKLTEADFLILLKGYKTNKQNWKVAPPNGLYLYKINYNIEILEILTRD
jgi:tRNA pseudouridine38-40 synthase